ncbi:MAG: UDP-N-acetylmuramoyl-tripeptide--D-alanyl-D-alanine ligase [Bacteroidales bacterium]|nr:UDP-N-acetylmuramoyl-tripeptide--D-alanyl-D-alanine ligase [Lachnoclostridium sp.]MCM1383970.1 UDP-N-acetylmuramoyl-tripeptide--D-alanyl-D-alanine ligase [Lachnoclostridium sp.]MCM1464679.1 UDP-N-acetylmuramoyl-tripeptide--D-alanyl-D-alanine ligase [Bacteroidales bacterium]
MNLSLYEIEKACGGTLVLKQAEGSAKVDSVVIDSRKATEGGVFVATVGERVDGHKFVPEVFAKGVSLVITQKTPQQVEEEHGAPASAWKSYLLVKDAFGALRDLAEYYRGKLSIPIVGITGSVGKTSTKEVVASVLGEKYHVLKTMGNFNNEIGVPLTLLSIKEEHEAAVIEMGISDFGEMHRLSKMVRPNICLITNIGQCHLENLKSRDGILKAKTEIFDYMEENGQVCLNGEDDKLASITDIRGKKPHFFGMGSNAEEEVYATDVVSKGLWGSEALLHMPDKEQRAVFSIQVPLPGVHMVINSTAAACVGGLLGVSKEQIAEGIRKLAAIGGRNHLIKLSRYTLIDDCYNANPVSMKAAIDLLDMADTKKAAILGDMFELGENSDEMHEGVGAYAAKKGIDYILCVGENARHMYEAACREAENMQGRCSVPRIFYFAGRQKLLAALKENQEEFLPEKSTVLVKASHGMEFTEVLEYLTKQG